MTRESPARTTFFEARGRVDDGQTDLFAAHLSPRRGSGGEPLAELLAVMAARARCANL